MWPPSLRRVPPASFRGISTPVLVVLSFVAILIAVGFAIQRRLANRAFARAAVQTEAEITEIRWKDVGPLPERDRLAFPMLRFMLPDGSLYETRSERPTRQLAGEIGDRVPILYLPEEPGRARVQT
jgi:hypothetical protein